MYIQPLYPQTNWILNATNESNINGWNLYNNGTGTGTNGGTQPTTGTGGTPANITLTQTTTNPISGNASLLITKNAANVQGEGLSYDFTVDRANLARIQQISFTIELTTGSIALGDLTLWVYDKTNAVLIQPTQYQFPSATVGTSPIEYQIVATFQTNITSTSYRLICHFSTTVTGALTFKMDNVVVGPQQISYGSADSDWIAYTATIGGTTTAPTPGSGYTQYSFWRRVGDSCQIRWNFSQTSAGTNGSGTYLLPIPSGLTIDTTKVQTSTGAIGSGGSVVGTSQLSTTTTGATQYATLGTVIPYNTTNLMLVTQNGSNTSAALYAMGSSNLAMGSSLYYFAFEATVPILGWSSAVRMSQPDATRTVAFRAHNTGTQTISTVTAVAFGTTDEDTHAAISGNTYVVPVSGYYDFSYLILHIPSGAVNISSYFTKNGTQVGGTTEYQPSGGGIPFSNSEALSFNCNAGDVIGVSLLTSSGNTVVQANSYFCGHRIAGPERIAASEKVHSEYNNNAGQSITGGSTNITNTTLVYDSHNAYNTSTGVWTAPRAGTAIITAFTTWTSAQTGYLQLYKNSSALYGSAAISSTVLFAASWQTYVNAGDTLSIRSNNSGTISTGATASASTFTMS